MGRVRNLTQWRKGAKAQRMGWGNGEWGARAVATAFEALWIPAFAGMTG